MDNQELLTTAAEILKEWTIEIKYPEENRQDVYIDAINIKPAINALLIEGHWGYLSAITGLDSPEYEVDAVTNEKVVNPEKGTLELLYHFSNAAAVTSLRVKLPYLEAQIDSICGMVPSASFYEREAMELLGIEFKDTPITSHLILPDDWPAGVYPLRKSFKGFEKKTQG